MDDDFKITPSGIIEPLETEEKPKPKQKARKAKVALRDDMYLALHGLYSSKMSIKRGSIFFLDDHERIERLLKVNAIRKVQDAEIKDLASVVRYSSLLLSSGYLTAGAFLEQSNSEIIEFARIPRNLVMNIRKIIEDELTK